VLFGDIYGSCLTMILFLVCEWQHTHG